MISKTSKKYKNLQKFYKENKLIFGPFSISYETVYIVVREMKKKLISLVLISILSTNVGFARSYPIKDIIKTNKGQSYSYALPRISGGNYLVYKNNPLYRQTYTMLWGSTYFDGRDMGMGGHQGIDIASNQGTPVYAIASGVVIFA